MENFYSMQDQVISRAGIQNRVLRNTYWLLSLTLIPTFIGAIIGINVGPIIPTGMMGALLFLGISYGFFYFIEKTKNSGAGVLVLLGFTFFMGLMLSGILQRTLRLANGPQIIAIAAVGTALIFVCSAVVATVAKTDFSKYGRFLFIAVIALIVAGLANIYFQLPLLHLLLSIAAIVIFSLFLIFDVQRIVRGGETSYISATLSVYLSLYNIFTSLLSVLGISGGRQE